MAGYGAAGGGFVEPVEIIDLGQCSLDTLVAVISDRGVCQEQMVVFQLIFPGA